MIKGVPRQPFIGELKCIEVDTVTAGSTPQALTGVNDFTGSARIYASTTGNGGSVDVREYSAIGIQSVVGASSGPIDTGVLCLGTNGGNCTTATHASCPGTLILDHFFDGADPFGDNDSVGTTLTLVPCTEAPETQIGPPGITVAQLLIINEFEQRFSSNRHVQCFETTRLSDIDSVPGVDPGDATSIFSVGVQGTITGQTRIRGVPTNEAGHGLLGISEETHSGARGSFSTAANLHFDGSRGAGFGDTISIPAP
ncbi:MAG: hypothetical protein HYR72_05345 [Deltaproteobacteria bacterium]|nr:hypothetical protein [Deltaproteobacteria bacterium]MBI3389686.1 hypothetical protein [Deltaproteobacteria bacterium]